MKTIPCDVEIEKKLISALMLKDGVAVSQAVEVLREDDFYRPEHRLIYRALVKLNDAGTPLDILLVERELELSDNLKRVTRSYLYGLLNLEHTTGRVPEYAAIIKELAQQRELYYLGQALKSLTSQGSKTSKEIAAYAQSKIISAMQDSKDNIADMSQVLVAAYEQMHKRERGITTGLLDLNTATGGLKKSDLIILAARPSMGKTALALNIATAAAQNNIVLMFSLEMSKVQLGQRIISAASQVSATRIQNGDELTDEENNAIAQAISMLGNYKLYVDETRGLSLMELRQKARQFKHKHGLDLIVIDYMQLMQGSKEYCGNRVQEVSEISRGLKALAGELDISILALSQLSRATEMRAEKKPQLSDLRESGSIEQDADIVMFLYRDEYYNHDTENQNIAELIIAKNRNGATGVVRLQFEKEYVLFRNLLRE